MGVFFSVFAPDTHTHTPTNGKKKHPTVFFLLGRRENHPSRNPSRLSSLPKKCLMLFSSVTTALHSPKSTVETQCETQVRSNITVPAPPPPVRRTFHVRARGFFRGSFRITIRPSLPTATKVTPDGAPRNRTGFRRIASACDVQRCRNFTQ